MPNSVTDRARIEPGFFVFEFGSVRLRFQKRGLGSIQFGFCFKNPVRVRFGSTQTEPNRTEPNLSGLVPVLTLVSVLSSSTNSTENRIYSKNYCFLVGSAAFDSCFDGSGRVWFGSVRLDIWKVGSSSVRFDFGLCYILWRVEYAPSMCIYVVTL